jgi:allantoicase
VRGCDARDGAGDGTPDEAEWFELLPPARLQPDTRHRFRIDPARSHCATHVRLEIHPDGGLARLRLFGELTGDGRAQLGLAWFDRLPGDQALTVLATDCGLAGPPAAQLAAGRPYHRPDRFGALLSGGELTGLDATAARRVRALVLG